MAQIPDINIVVDATLVVLTPIQTAVRQKLAMAGDDAEFTLEEFSVMVSMDVKWVRKNLAKIPGRCGYSNKCQRIHWGTTKRR